MKRYLFPCVFFLLFLIPVHAPDWPTIKELIHNSFPQVSHLSTDSLSTLMSSGKEPAPLILDVREPDEFEVSHLLGAYRARTEQDALILLKGIPEDTLIVAYCSVGYRSSELVARLKDQGFTNIYNLEGSIFEWANKGLPLFHDSHETNTVHPYDEEWGILLDRKLWSWDQGDSTSTHSSQIE